jgi:integrase
MQNFSAFLPERGQRTMPRTKRGTPPSYRRHSSGQACVTIRDATGRRREILLGPWNSTQSKTEYARVLAELASNGGHLAGRGPGSLASHPDLSINELIVAFWRYAEEHYRRPDDQPTGELDNLRDALHPLRQLYGNMPTSSFDSLALETIQDHLVRSGRLARTTINARINRIRRVFRWAVRKKLVPAEVLLSIEAVPGLKKNRSSAREPEPVAPVAREHVKATLSFLPRPVAAMVQLQMLCDCRAGEVMVMRGCDLTRGDSVWVYEPRLHKNTWRGKPRKIFLGPQARAIVEEFLRSDPEEYLFRPCDATREHHARRAAGRKTPRTASELRRRAVRQPRRKPRARYDRRSYRQAIVRACRKAGVPKWSPLQLRHTCATGIRQQYGLEASQCVLGHERADVTQIYAERNDALAAKIMAEIG